MPTDTDRRRITSPKNLGRHLNTGYPDGVEQKAFKVATSPATLKRIARLSPRERGQLLEAALR